MGQILGGVASPDAVRYQRVICFNIPTGTALASISVVMLAMASRQLALSTCCA